MSSRHNRAMTDSNNRDVGVSSVCPRCGNSNLESARFCVSCGTPLAAQPSTQSFAQSRPAYFAPPRYRTGIGNGTIIIVIVLVVTIAVASVAGALFFLYSAGSISRTSLNPGAVTISGLFLAIIYPDSSSNYFGPAYRFLNNALAVHLQHGETFQTEFTLTLQGTSSGHSVDSINLGFSGEFTIQSVTPAPPVTMAAGSSTSFAVTLQAPNSDYNGPVTIDIFTR